MENNQKSTNSNSSTGVIADSEEEEQDEPSSSTYQVGQPSAEKELASFRARWQQELQSQPTARDQLSIKQTATSQKFEQKLKSFEDNNSDEKRASTLFLKGIELEKAGKLYEAIQFYRRAVQIVPDIEFKLDYQPKQTKEVNIEHFEETHETDDDSDDSDEDDVIEDGQLISRVQKKIAKAGSLCIPKFNQSATHVSTLPLEILRYILRWVVSTDLDLRSLEMFGSVCRGFYLCSRDPEIWKLACLRIWGLNCNPTPDFYGSWRHMFIERPRLNFNGCYISKTSYIRHGENSFQDQFYRPWHLVTYYRYLRFFPEGIVLMLTSPDDPTQCVNQMKTRQPRQPVMVGYYRLKDGKVTLVVQRQESPKAMQSTYRKNIRIREVDNADQTFHMRNEMQGRMEYRGLTSD